MGAIMTSSQDEQEVLLVGLSCNIKQPVPSCKPTVGPLSSGLECHCTVTHCSALMALHGIGLSPNLAAMP
eukprot:15345166-Ditylum_brightwellii.AAC.1